MRQIAEGKKKIYAVTDKIGSPTYTVDLSKSIASLIKTNYYGLYHVACKGKATRFDVAKRIIEYLNRDDIQLIPVSSDFFSEEYFAPRPKSEVLRNYILDLRKMNNMRCWKSALKDYLTKKFSNFMR